MFICAFVTAIIIIRPIATAVAVTFNERSICRWRTNRPTSRWSG